SMKQVSVWLNHCFIRTEFLRPKDRAKHESKQSFTPFAFVSGATDGSVPGFSRHRILMVVHAASMVAAEAGIGSWREHRPGLHDYARDYRSAVHSASGTPCSSGF